jgi:hypothetical protein
MKKIFILPVFIVLILPMVLGIGVSVEKQSENEVLVTGLDKLVVFDLKVRNLGEANNFEFYNLLGFNMFPKGTVQMGEGESQDIELKISPIGDFPHKGAYTFTYFIKGQAGGEIQEKLTFKIVDFADCFEVGSGEVDSDLNSLDVYIHNKVNFDFGEINVKFSSAFFDFEEEFELGPNERKDFTVQLNKDDFKKLMAGFYTLNAEVVANAEKVDVEGVIKFVEKNLLTTTKEDYGIVINTKIIEKMNEGNVVVKSETLFTKNIISRLFTSFSPQPDVVERQGMTVFYSWNREIKPGETLEIVVKTNWFFPLITIFFIVAIVVLAKQYSMTNLVLRKKVTFVKAKGGEFALKVTIFAQAKKYIERVNIIDRLPAMVKVYEKFGVEKPSRVNEKTRRIEWNFEKLETGEVRVLSYIIEEGEGE